MKRILIIGSGGAGKSTLGKRLEQVLEINVVHLDRLYWQDGWVKLPKDAWNHIVGNLINNDSWILDGNFGGTLDLRIAACDTIIFLDLSPLICLYRVLKRRLKYRDTNRSDMADGCKEKVDFEFLSWILLFRRSNRPKLLDKFRNFDQSKQLFILQTQNDIEHFVSKLCQMK